MEVSLLQLERAIRELLAMVGMTEENATRVAWVYMEATLRGTGHHDVHMLPERIRKIEQGKINPAAEIELLHQNKAIENYDGSNGMGELHAFLAAKRSIELARKFGVGICSVRNSNHNLCNGPYTELMAAEGMFGYMLTKAGPTMGAPGRKEKVCGAIPQGFAAPYGDGDFLAFDACLSYATNSLLEDCIQAGRTIPKHWAVDVNGQPTDQPQDVFAGGSRQPIGAHKGFGLSLAGEILTGILSEGEIIDQPQENTGIIGKPAHTAICIDIAGLIGTEIYPQRVSEMIQRIKNRAEHIIIPNEKFSDFKKKTMAKQEIDLDQSLIQEMNQILHQYGLKPLI